MDYYILHKDTHFNDISLLNNKCPGYDVGYLIEVISLFLTKLWITSGCIKQ